jgi:hypothetical protein
MRATYSPEDNKLRLYADGRLDSETYQRVKAAGFKWAPKQELFVAPSWSPAREDLLLELCGEIEDEDYSPEERSADRAERFSDYRDKRRAEAGGLADTFEAGPSAFGHQSRARAERQASRHDRFRRNAVSQWSKAEYWQSRTAGVISHALHKSDARTRRGRIKKLESEQRKIEKGRDEYAAEFSLWSKVAGAEGADQPIREGDDGKLIASPAGALAYRLANVGGGGWHHKHPRTGRESSLYSLLTDKADPITPAEAAALWLKGKPEPGNPNGWSARWLNHYENRLTYERAMLANEGGSATEVEMEPGGWIGSRQIHGVTRSPATKKIVSVKLLVKDRQGNPVLASMNIERLGEDAYRPPTDEERAAFEAETKARKAAKPTVSLINPTDEDAQRLQDHLNEEAAKAARERSRQPSEPRKVLRVTQAEFSRHSGPEGMYQVRELTIGGSTFKVRTRHAGFYDYAAARSVIVLTDKPQKPLPVDWAALAPAPEPEAVAAPSGGLLFA